MAVPGWPDASAPAASPRVFLAYDGSINADWVTRYAIRIAANLSPRRIHLLHIPDQGFPLETVRLKIQAIEGECAFHGVEAQVRIEPQRSSVLQSLLAAIPPGPENFCVCGARITSRRGGFLRGTISEQLLRAGRFNVLALRVVQPGLLGCPEDLLFPLAGHPRGFQAAMPFFRLLTPGIRNLYLLRIMLVNPLRRRYLSRKQERALARLGLDYVQQVAAEILREEEGQNIHVDSRVVVASDWAREILVQASELRARLILLGASEERFPLAPLRALKIEEILRRTPCDVAIYRKA